MKKVFLLIGLLSTSACLSYAQVSWMSRPLQSNPYVAPIDQNLLFNSMAQRQQQYDHNVQKIQNIVLEATENIKNLKDINDSEYKRLSNALNDSIKKLNSIKRDYSLREVVNPILKHFSELNNYALLSREYLLPNSIVITNF